MSEMVGLRRLYTVAGVATRRAHRDGQESTDVNVWNGTTFAENEEMARMLTLGAMLVEWPMRDGWTDHTAFVKVIGDDIVTSAYIEPYVR